MEKPEATVEKLVNVQEMARVLSVPVSWLYERTRLGTIPCIRIGKYVRFDPAEVLAFFRKQKPDGQAGSGGTFSA
ncbi:MAG: hypothetical protein COV76_08200 [Candidatus Omnitrophica bacterium CG11_big_fil_rev_8_21_14_0_20_64_10]|nr:MAG: hypothetical protein COV76_08200 [Candidatus Omnitrophica bacterium CG11_big_fil_rev_8_21_14_0_20_64_10]